MRAIVIDRWIEPAALREGEAPEPTAGAGEVLIDVHAAGCNFFDALQVQGKYQERRPFPFVLGAECAGVVAAVGDGVTTVRPGDRVMAGLVYGTFAERVAVPASRVQRIPGDLSFAEAAAFPVVYPTAFAALTLRGGLVAGETVLVTAAAGGVGVAAVQLAKALGARVIALAGGDDKCAVARRAGADEAFDYRAADWTAKVLAATGGRGVDVVVESVGGEVFDGAAKCLAWSGRLVVVGFAGGAIPSVPANRILLKNVAIVGLHLGTYLKQAPAAFAKLEAALHELCASGAVRPLLSQTFPLARVSEALVALASRASWGKVVLTIRDSA